MPCQQIVDRATDSDTREEVGIRDRVSHARCFGLELGAESDDAIQLY